MPIVPEKSKSTYRAEGKRWCFTVNNYTEEEYGAICAYVKRAAVAGFGVVAREVGDTGTPHVQGYIRLGTKARLTAMRKNISPRGHFELAKGTDQDNKTYCTKQDGDALIVGRVREQTTEHGGFNGLGERVSGIISDMCAGASLGTIASGDHEKCGVIVTHGARISELFYDIENTRRLADMGRGFGSVSWKPWQSELISITEGPICPRAVHWIYDAVGNSGKTFVSKYLMTKGAIRFENGKSADIKYAYQGESIVIFDLARSQEDRVNYEVMESIKNGVLFSPKYTSKVKVFDPPHLIILANFLPDESKMSADRWNVITI